MIQRDNQDEFRELEEILGRVDALPILDRRSQKEIIGYDLHGLPE